jgi:hypothetical protein
MSGMFARVLSAEHARLRYATDGGPCGENFHTLIRNPVQKTIEFIAFMI